MKNILCSGNVSVDIKAYSAEVDDTEAYREGSIELVPGGVGRGMAINLKHLGFNTFIHSVVGKDIFGEYLRNGLIVVFKISELLSFFISKVDKLLPGIECRFLYTSKLNKSVKRNLDGELVRIFEHCAYCEKHIQIDLFECSCVDVIDVIVNVNLVYFIFLFHTLSPQM